MHVCWGHTSWDAVFCAPWGLSSGGGQLVSLHTQVCPHSHVHTCPPAHIPMHTYMPTYACMSSCPCTHIPCICTCARFSASQIRRCTHNVHFHVRAPQAGVHMTHTPYTSMCMSCTHMSSVHTPMHAHTHLCSHTQTRAHTCTGASHPPRLQGVFLLPVAGSSSQVSGCLLPRPLFLLPPLARSAAR